MAKIKLLHWNILYQEKAENILSLVQRINPDIFCCQEISDKNPNSKELLSGLTNIYKQHYLETADIIGKSGENLKLGNAIFSKFPLSNRKRVDLWNGPNPTSDNQHEQRIYIEVTLDVSGHNLTVGTTHLSFAPYFTDTPDRLAQSEKLMRVIESKESNYIITGDFNSAPKTEIIKTIEKHLVSAGPPDSKPTFTTIPFSFLGFDAKGLEWRVDYVFATKDISIISSKIIQTKYSDHLPILVELEI
ncbi:MAG TPA: endonuclease/exonuclease/phosphatase family protein [Candidatus Saccharimonadales bacterium]|nr:endonuclease/exonuclease/phosphatase family protein [Candidatus Saccharimonadales bacterium]